eukprot:11438910-Karenia_brevis.AAC.1
MIRHVGPSCAMLGHVGTCWDQVGTCLGQVGICWRKLEHVRAKLGHVGAKFEHVGAKLKHVGTKLGHVRPKLGHVGAKFGMLRSSLARSRPSLIWLERSQPVKRNASCLKCARSNAGPLGPSWSHVGAKLGARHHHQRPKLEHVQAQVKTCWAKLGHVRTKLGYVGTYN